MCVAGRAPPRRGPMRRVAPCVAPLVVPPGERASHGVRWPALCRPALTNAATVECRPMTSTTSHFSLCSSASPLPVFFLST
ncbi:hypothetical protein GUJ93_ZPchr0008g13226 [Zizania palustris]|uniref:Uncharacterized protein n=1 Tax=Zizania palustris TaxID=103762 RepID=A0A8J5RZX8_ZIZPA|nr:hypothetical protein GUJ93_ZPchr0008g13226 [Zizania palustris]